MSLTRSFLKGMGLTEEQVSAIIEEHVDSTNALKEQRDAYKDDAAKLKDVQKELDDLKAKGGDWEKKYTEEHDAFEKFKAAQDAKQNEVNKRDAYRALLRQANVSDARIDTVLKVTDLAQLELKDGKFTNEDELTESIKKEWADFITTSSTSGASTQTPPANGGSNMTMKEIYKKDERGRYVLSASERQKALIELEKTGE